MEQGCPITSRLGKFLQNQDTVFERPKCLVCAIFWTHVIYTPDYSVDLLIEFTPIGEASNFGEL